MAGSGCTFFQRIQLHHAAHRFVRHDGTGDFISGGTRDDTQADCLQNRPVRAHGRAANTSGQGGHTYHGRCADPDVYSDYNLAVGRLAEPLCMGGVVHYAGFWRGWLGG